MGDWMHPHHPHQEPVDHNHVDHDADDCPKCQTDRIIRAINQQGETLMATIEEIKAKLDQLTVQETGETNLAPGQVAVAQADLDAIAAHVDSLIDQPAPPAPPA